MDYKSLVNEKEQTISGGSVNYYLQIVPGSRNLSDTTVEIEDIIEALAMSFAAGNVFKALVRICKLRMDLGKPGSTKIYEVEKVLYYSKRTLVVSNRRWKSNSLKFIFKTLGFINTVVLGMSLTDNKKYKIISIPDPKRLDPYSFYLDDFIKSLNPTKYESIVLKNILTLSLMRSQFLFPRFEEVMLATETVTYAELLEKGEKLGN